MGFDVKTSLSYILIGSNHQVINDKRDISKQNGHTKTNSQKDSFPSK